MLLRGTCGKLGEPALPAGSFFVSFIPVPPSTAQTRATGDPAAPLLFSCATHSTSVGPPCSTFKIHPELEHFSSL